MWCPITYYEFYDVPRLFVVERRGRVVVFDCPFDDDEDEYVTQYAVYCFSELPESVLNGAYLSAVLSGKEPFGRVAVDAVVFDDSRRKAIDDYVLNALLGE